MPLQHTQAAWFGHMETAAVLLEAGADLGAVTADGSTALWCAKHMRQQAMVELLLAYQSSGGGNIAQACADAERTDRPAVLS